MRFLPVLTACGLVLAGCVATPQQYETAPVVLETPQGPVTCQLYTREIVAWDRAIDRPARMSVKDADTWCHNEGVRRQRDDG